MNILENAVKTDFQFEESTALINVVLYELSLKLGKQIVTNRFIDLLEELENGKSSGVPDLQPSLETGMIALGTRIQQALEKQYAMEWKDVKVEVILARWNLSRDGDTPSQYIGFQVSIEAEEARLVNIHADFSILNDAFIPVDIERIPAPDIATIDEPICYLNMATIKDLCHVDEVTSEVMESVSIAALAMGWNDTESYGKTMILVG
ncbi:hypothetical protein BIZ78_gp095 [Erwinia phage vB_EamM_Caitlin]|uniref:hypothetical protein n=1 Tax=Erwinia phage vB_EamM_Caitlin TaxID=1883379 RepID=UPI00081D209A|nr:hypothetical protein BIZ78_gp095 [Erwinia phage vB_EamM_Caitlin]ANZ48480.1 hypothetical protein CAITLIN_185 [Erwinia phage vB_EamM_Caitlin]